MQRNVCVALGNIGDLAAVPALAKALSAPEPIIREHAAWALGRLGGDAVLLSLRDALPGETAEAVRAEIALSLSEAGAPVPS